MCARTCTGHWGSEVTHAVPAPESLAQEQTWPGICHMSHGWEYTQGFQCLLPHFCHSRRCSRDQAAARALVQSRARATRRGLSKTLALCHLANRSCSFLTTLFCVVWAKLFYSVFKSAKWACWRCPESAQHGPAWHMGVTRSMPILLFLSILTPRSRGRDQPQCHPLEAHHRVSGLEGGRLRNPEENLPCFPHCTRGHVKKSQKMELEDESGLVQDIFEIHAHKGISKQARENADCENKLSTDFKFILVPGWAPAPRTLVSGQPESWWTG